MPATARTLLMVVPLLLAVVPAVRASAAFAAEWGGSAALAVGGTGSERGLGAAPPGRAVSGQSASSLAACADAGAADGVRTGAARGFRP
jgi:hypothetical protein